MLIESAASLMFVMALAATPPEPHDLTLDQAVQQVQAQTGGRVLSADRVRSRHGRKYRIKMLLDDGRVRVIEVHSNDEDDTSGTPRTKPAAAKEVH